MCEEALKHTVEDRGVRAEMLGRSGQWGELAIRATAECRAWAIDPPPEKSKKQKATKIKGKGTADCADYADLHSPLTH